MLIAANAFGSPISTFTFHASCLVCWTWQRCHRGQGSRSQSSVIRRALSIFSLSSLISSPLSLWAAR